MTDEQRAKRLHYHMYDSLEGIEDHANRIVDLEELVQDMWPAYCFAQSGYEGDGDGLSIEIAVKIENIHFECTVPAVECGSCSDIHHRR